MNTRFFEIRAEMSRQKISGADMAEKLGISPAAFSARINGRSQFSLKQAYQIMKILGLPMDHFSRYFPTLEVLS